MLQTNYANYVRGRFYDNFKPFFGDGLLTTDGDFWLRHRRAVQPLFHRRQVQLGSQQVTASVATMLDKWQSFSDSGQDFDVVPEMMWLTLSVLGKTIFGVDVAHLTDVIGPAVHYGVAAMMPQGNINDFVPRWVPTPHNRRIDRARRALAGVMQWVRTERVERGQQGHDLTSLLLAASDDPAKKPLTDKEVEDEMMTIFLAGHETTASGLAWALYALATHPEVRLQLEHELAVTLGGGTPSADDLPNLPYLCKVVDECLRVYPPIWGFTRDADRDDEIGGYHIPSGSSVFVSPYVTHRHPRFWDDPETFDPERFTPEQVAARPRFAYFPFGGGPRQCIGIHMAKLQMQLAVAMIVQRYRFDVVPTHPIERGATVSPAAGPRDPAHDRAAHARAPPGRRCGCRDGPTACRRVPVRAGIERCRHPTGSAECLGSPFADSSCRHRGCAGAGAAERPAARQAAGRRRAPDRRVRRSRVGAATSREHRSFNTRMTAATVAAFARRFGTVDGIVDLNIDEPLTSLATGQWEPALRRSLALLRACYDDWAAEGNAERLFYMAVTQIGGNDGAGRRPGSQPLGGIWAGLAKTLPREDPQLQRARARIRRPTPARTRARTDRAVELYHPGYCEIGYRDDTRYSLLARDEEAGTPDHLLTTSDVVLLSGGARGIGLALAEDLAVRFGCRIVITGRTPVPATAQPFVRMDEGQFRAFQHQRLKEAAGSGRLAQVRAENEFLGKQRRLRAELSRLHDQGLRIEYVECDVTSTAQVRAAVERAGEDLSVVVHNAGVDAPVRLPAKSDDVFLSVVRTKVDGFLGLVRAIEDNGIRLKMFCNVGSLTGRWGGMVGEIDYAAANEALSTLGLWASRLTSFPVKTLCWPTWERLGMIKNFDVAATYSSALDRGRRGEQVAGRAPPGSVRRRHVHGRTRQPGLSGVPRRGSHPPRRRPTLPRSTRNTTTWVTSFVSDPVGSFAPCIASRPPPRR